MIKKFQFIQEYISKEAISGIVLFLATILAILIANTSFAQTYFDFWQAHLGLSLAGQTYSMSLEHWINDGLMALFFLMVGLEIKREMVIGELSSLSKAAFPIVGALGGMAIPALIYVLFNLDNPLGFGIPMATDIAFALGILMLLGSKVNPALKLFLVALAVVDDLGAVMVVATVYTKEVKPEYFIHAGLVYAAIWGLNRFGVTRIIPYLILGAFLWFFIHAIGIHATIAGVLLAFAIPIQSKIDEDQFIKNTKSNLDDFAKYRDSKPILNHHQVDSLESIAYSYEKVQNPLVRLEHSLHGLSAFFIMPIFAFANAGLAIDFSNVSANLMVVLGVIFGLLLGKPIGIFGFTYLVSKTGWITKPQEISWYEVLSVGILSGIGFTMSIFITNLAFTENTVVASVKLGVFIASLLAAIIGVLMLLVNPKKVKTT
jgi:Na+:H+ antiporter, NhaA family